MSAIGVSELDTWWPQLKEGLEDLIRKTHPTWMPEHVYYQVKSANALLVVMTHDGEFEGFYVIGRDIDKLTQNTDLLIWIAYSKGKKHCVEFGDEMICAFGRQNGFHYAVGYSPRLAWARRAERMGYRVRTVVLHKPLTEAAARTLYDEQADVATSKRPVARYEAELGTNGFHIFPVDDEVVRH